MSRTEVEEFRKDKEKAFVSSICLDLKPPYAAQVEVKPYPMGYVLNNFKTLIKGEITQGNMLFASLTV